MWQRVRVRSPHRAEAEAIHYNARAAASGAGIRGDRGEVNAVEGEGRQARCARIGTIPANLALAAAIPVSATIL